MGVVVITGASSGIGEAAARELARGGHKLVLAARRAERLAALEGELSQQTEVLTVTADVGDGAQVEALARQAAERFGTIDVWVNNAGLGPQGRWWEMEQAAIAQVVDVNLTAPLLSVRAALPYMKARGRGHFINVASVSGHIGNHALYSATKFGLVGLSEALGRELKPLGIQVSVVSPGFIATEMTRGVTWPMPGPEVVARVIARLIRRPKREVVVPGWYRVLIWLNAHFRWVTDAVLARQMQQGKKVGRR
ncbi:MAG TPA: SDR family NAD(P)-dependent oxidoreductase [Symbiobacteriaceae bacterium]|nr:SDR family NAD(P)-dependent oxidoreductase [Symbiobacteriaceae bacterium]